METVQVVIRIPKDEYDYIIANPLRYNVCDDETLLYNYIKNGIVLPKGHGELKDISEIMHLWQNGDYDSIVSALICVPAIIETDKEV